MSSPAPPPGRVPGQEPVPYATSAPPQLRAGDADREAVAELLRQAAGDGRLTLTELDERLETTYAARTYVELERVTADLPVHRPAPGPVPLHPPSGPAPRVERLMAVFGEEKRAGRWEVPPLVEARCVFGSVEVDLTEAVSRVAEVVVEGSAVFGELKVIVPEGVAVVMEPGTSVFGERTCTVPQPAGVPTLTVRVRGSAVFGSITVRGPKRRRWLTS